MGNGANRKEQREEWGCVAYSGKSEKREVGETQRERNRKKNQQGSGEVVEVRKVCSSPEMTGNARRRERGREAKGGE